MPQRGSSKVLIGEGDARLRRILRLNLERKGLETIEGSTLPECEARLQQGDVGLAIISSQLPGFDPQQFPTWLRSRFPQQALPVVILSFEAEDRLLAGRLRLATFKRKPFDPEELVDDVTRLMRAS